MPAMRYRPPVRKEDAMQGNERNEHLPKLHRDNAGLYLEAEGMTLRADFANMLKRIEPGRLNRELLVRAARVKNADDAPFALDACAGLGEDALLLAAAGFNVCLIERDHIIAELLRDGLARAAEVYELASIVERMELKEGDSIDAMRSLKAPPDVVYLDPMFPARHKSAAVKKKFQILQLLETPAADEEALFEAAIALKPRKLVVKRPAKGPYLANVKPSYSLAGKAVRYDVIVSDQCPRPASALAR